ncbi:MAG TPA: malonic semialdehyde reductase [Xanthomonadaceae bacterium]|nr:malonic semialdehyde reductase [Xanthomonadaceae bacterium]
MLDSAALDLIFRDARTFTAWPDTWQDREVGDDQLRQIWDLARLGPTSSNCSPARVLFVRSQQARQRLAPALDDINRTKTLEAPVTAILAMDLDFPEKLPYLFPHADAKAWFEGDEENVRSTAFRNSSLQGAYLIIAARALGLDTGPMSGFDNDKVDAEFFAGTRIRSNFLINIGYGNRASLFPRHPRLSFDEACCIL